MRNSTLTKAKAILGNRRYQAQLQCDKLSDKLNTLPQWAQLQRDIRRADLDISIARAQQLDLAQLQSDRQLLHAQADSLLAKLGLSQDSLTPHYHCAKCNDTGYTDGKMCSCLIDIIRSIVVGNNSIDLPTATFEASSDSNEHNSKVYKVCHKLCHNIDNTAIRNVLLTGKTGTGKTHLLACMANSLLSTGYETVVLTAYSLNQQLLQVHLASPQERAEYLDNINDIDVLIIDDLGTENKYNNVTNEYIFSIINQRLLTKKHTFVSTNLNLREIQDRYGDRIFSRLADKSITLTAELTAHDKRIK